MSDVIRQSVTVENENGLHMVPCSQIAQLASEFECDVHIQKDDKRVDAKTVLQLMTLAAEQGTTLVLEASGTDAPEAVDQLVRLFASRFEVLDDA